MRHRLVPLWIGLGAALLAWAVSGAVVARRAELALLDARFVFRERFPGSTPVPVRDDLILVGMDERTYELYENPGDPRLERRNAAFWLPLYARVLAGAVDAGATVAALDLVPKYFREEMFQELGALLAPRQGRILLTALLQVPQGGGPPTLEAPDPLLAALVSDAEGRNLCLNNVPRDLDGIVRSQLPGPIDVQALGVEGEASMPLLAVRLAEKHRGEVPAPPLFDGHRMLINYAGPPLEVFPFVPMWRVLQALDEGDSGYLRRTFRGRAVVLGPWAVRDADFVETPFYAGEARSGTRSLAEASRGARGMPGVEVLLHIANTLLTGAWLLTVPAPASLALLVLVTVLAASLAGRLSTLPGVAAGLAVAASWVALAWWAFAATWTWVEVVPALLAVPTALLGVYAWRYWFEERAAAQVRRLFGRYVSPEVMEELLHDPRKQALGATEKRVVTVLFTDINGFSTVAERHTPEEILAMLNRYFEEMTGIIFRHRGTVKQFVGDEILAFYGAPREHPEPERAAVATALEMVERLEELRASDPTGARGFYSCKIGIHTGEVIVGNVGSADRAEYAAVGDDVNLGSRIMGMTKSVGATILISGSTWSAVRAMPGVEFVPHGEREVKGRREKVAIYEVRAARGAALAGVAPAGGGRPG